MLLLDIAAVPVLQTSAEPEFSELLVAIGLQRVAPYPPDQYPSPLDPDRVNTRREHATLGQPLTVPRAQSTGHSRCESLPDWEYRSYRDIASHPSLAATALPTHDQLPATLQGKRESRHQAVHDYVGRRCQAELGSQTHRRVVDNICIVSGHPNTIGSALGTRTAGAQVIASMLEFDEGPAGEIQQRHVRPANLAPTS